MINKITNKGNKMGNKSSKQKNMWPLLMGLGLTGCFGMNWSDLGTTWDTDVVATNDAVYVILPVSEQLVKVSADGHYNVVDINGAEPKSLVASPDGTRLPWIQNNPKGIPGFTGCYSSL